MNPYDELKNKIESLEKILGVSWTNKDLLLTSFIHRSFFNENRKDVKEHNERLEFLGDSVLSMVVCDYLFQLLPQADEGTLSMIRASMVSAPACKKYLQKLHLEEFLLLGKGEKATGGREKENILADLFEAIIGALYLDKGFFSTRDFLLSHFGEDFAKSVSVPSRNYKEELQLYSQKEFQKLPEYVVHKEIGPDHAKIFEVAVMVNGQEFSKGKGSSKKEAEQNAAERAIKMIQGEK
jgi:ribonuclease III